jgi:hypothetical protein
MTYYKTALPPVNLVNPSVTAFAQGLMGDLGTQAPSHAPSPVSVAYTNAIVGKYLEGNPTVCIAARGGAEVLIDMKWLNARLGGLQGLADVNTVAPARVENGNVLWTASTVGDIPPSLGAQLKKLGDLMAGFAESLGSDKPTLERYTEYAGNLNQIDDSLMNTSLVGLYHLANTIRADCPLPLNL